MQLIMFQVQVFKFLLSDCQVIDETPNPWNRSVILVTFWPVVNLWECVECRKNLKLFITCQPSINYSFSIFVRHKEISSGSESVDCVRSNFFIQLLLFNMQCLPAVLGWSAWLQTDCLNLGPRVVTPSFKPAFLNPMAACMTDFVHPRELWRSGGMYFPSFTQSVTVFRLNCSMCRFPLFPYKYCMELTKIDK